MPSSPDVVADKGLDPDWITSLHTRGAPTVLTGNQLTYVGLPVGGVTCGQVYLGGDGRLWHWDVDNRTQPTKEGHYVSPVHPSSPFDLGLVLRTNALGQTRTRYLDGRGFDGVRFSGRYPVGQVTLSQTDLPLSVTCDAYSPFTPLRTADSSTPVVVLEYSVTNHAEADVHAELGVYAENPVCLGSRMERAVALRAKEISGTGYRGVQFEAAEAAPLDSRPFDELPDNGTFALAVTPPTNNGHAGIDEGWLDLATVARTNTSLADWSSPSAVFDSGAGAPTADGVSGTVAACVTIKLKLRPRETQTVRVLASWFFPVPDRAALSFLRDAATLKRHYVNQYDSAANVIDTVVGGLSGHERLTKLWTKTWYDDSTLPWWLLERVATTTATLATSTCYRFSDGRFYGWEGVSSCPGTCTHVWHYAQAAARIFPELERDTRERVDLGIGYHEDTGEIGMRAEADMTWATDGQCGTILRIYREHQMTSDGSWLRRVWPRVRRAVEFVIAHDLGQDGVVDGGQPNTLDATWYGRMSWMSSMYVAALRAAESMANEVGDTAFAATCARLAESGSTIIARDLWNGEYFIHEPDPGHAGTVNTNRGCFVDQILGQSWAHQVGLPRVLPADKSATALESLWRHNFCPRPIDYRATSPIKGGRTYYDADTPALLMCTWPMGGGDDVGSNWSLGYFNEAMNGFEYQAASHMIAEGLVEHGLAVTRAVHDRYRPDRRNPFNEIECGDHYARSMAAYGVYVNVLGYEYHGPRAYLGFAPKIQQDNFAAAFTAAEGWGQYRQRRTDSRHTSAVEVRFGSVTVATLRLDVPGSGTSTRVDVNGGSVAATAVRDAGGRLLVTLTTPVVLREGQTLTVTV